MRTLLLLLVYSIAGSVSLGIPSAFAQELPTPANADAPASLAVTPAASDQAGEDPSLDENAARPDSPVLPSARDVQRDDPSLDEDAAPSEDTLGTSREERPTSRWARAELAAVQTMVGTAVGAELCALAECDEARAWAGSALFGAGAGLALSLWTTRDGIPQGRALAVNSGAFFGTWLGGATIVIASNGDPNIQGAMSILLAGQATGIGLGWAADHVFKLSPGEVSLANSAALWTGISSLLALGALDPVVENGDVLGRRFLGVTMATTSLALVGGAMLARHDRVSRGRALMVDVGAIAGGGLSPLLVWLAGGDDASAEALLWSSVVGTVGGAVTAYAATREWDAPDAPPVSLSIAPTDGGAIASVKLTR